MHPLYLTALAIAALAALPVPELAAAEPSADGASPLPPLVVIYELDGKSSKVEIPWDELAKLPIHSSKLALEIDAEERMMTYVYFKDFAERFGNPQGIDFWLANCSDGYQSNFTPAVIENAKPYIILKVDDVPLPEWLAEISHPEWGPYIINTEDGSMLRDPGHKNPWGVVDIIATRYDQAISTLPASLSDLDNSLGLDIYLNACASCHDMPDSILGGSVSTRNAVMLGQFAKHSDAYFENMLAEPSATNPTANKMPSYRHYSDDERRSIKELLSSLLN